MDGGGLICLERDLSERKHLQQQLLHAQKTEAVGQLVGGVAHDFNNLLTAIISYAGLAMMKPPVEEGPIRFLQEIHRAAERAADLTRQLMVFSRRQMVEPTVVNLNDLVLDLHRMLPRLIGEDIELTIRPSTATSLVRVDPGQIDQVLINLAVNARDAMPDGGKLTMETANVTVEDDWKEHKPEVTPGEYVSLAVSDTGTGMPEDVKRRIFEPFFTTKAPGKGTGLGLSTCYGIIKQNDGLISVESVPGEGTCFRIYLPRVKEAASSLPRRGQPDRLPPGRETLLLVEDEEAIREVVSTVLREQGYTVLEASNGVEALGVARGHTPGEIDLLLTDVVMPVMGGTELNKQLKELHPSARVLFTSGYPQDTVEHHGVLGVSVRFLQKPFTTGALAHRVREVLDQQPVG